MSIIELHKVTSLNLVKDLSTYGVVLHSRTTRTWSESFGCGWWWLVCKAEGQSVTIHRTSLQQRHCCYFCTSTAHRRTDRSTPTSVISHSASYLVHKLL